MTRLPARPVVPEDLHINTLLKIVLAFAVTLLVCVLATLVAVAVSVLNESGFDADAEAGSEEPVERRTSSWSVEFGPTPNVSAEARERFLAEETPPLNGG